MPYLNAVLKESQRILPSASAKFMRCVPAGGAELVGFHLPEGTHVGANSWVIHHRKDIFGEDVDDFRPERWLGDNEALQLMKKFDFGFGMGARECAGKNVALVEIEKAVVQVSFQKSCENISLNR
jgi:cytochrome P450